MNDVLIGDCRDILPTLPAGTFRCCVTSPPYWNLRDYGHDGQIGREETLAEYIANLVEVFAAVRRVLAADGTLWINVGDTYARDGGSSVQGRSGSFRDRAVAEARVNAAKVPVGLKPKDMIGIPWRLALALQDDGWWLRSDIIWRKPNPMPESAKDRPTRAHEYVFLLAKSDHYFYDAAAIAETAKEPGRVMVHGDKNQAVSEASRGSRRTPITVKATRNARTVWTIPTQPYHGAHMAPMPTKLAARCIRAGSEIGDAVLDPFMGSGTVGMVAESLGRRWRGIEINADFEPLWLERTAQRGLPFEGSIAAGGAA